MWKSSVCTIPIFKRANLILNDAVLTNPENKSRNVVNNQSYSYAHWRSSELSRRRSCIPHSSKLLLSSKKNNHKCGAAPVIDTHHLHLLKLYFIVPCFHRCFDVRYLLCVYFFSLKYSAHGCNTHEDNVYTSMIKKSILHAFMYGWTLKHMTNIIYLLMMKWQTKVWTFTLSELVINDESFVNQASLKVLYLDLYQRWPLMRKISAWKFNYFISY